MYAAQSTWDEAMAASVRNAMQGFDGTMVVIAGSGHCAYNLGINRRVAEKLPVPHATVLPIAVSDWEETVVRSLADFLIGIPEDLDPPFYPQAGFGAVEREGKISVTMITPGSFAQEAGIKSGDLILGLDGEEVEDLTDFRIRLSEKKWGDSAELKLKRGDEEKVVKLTFDKDS